MPETAHGQIHWTELMTTDVAAARAFWARIAGWTYADMPMPGGAGTYTVFMAGEAPGGGIFDASDPEFAGLAPRWISYIHVDDVDAASAEVEAAGGTVHRAPFDIAGVGRIAVVADPTGAVIGLITPAARAG